MVRMASAPSSNRLRVEVYPKQHEFVTCQKPIRAFTGGRGSGKSKAGATDMLLKSKPDSTYIVVAPTYQVLGDATLRSFKEVAKAFGVWDDDGFRAGPPPSAQLENGAEYLFRSADNPDSLRGGDKSGAWLDEMQDADEEAYTIIIAALREHGKRGWLTATFTPGSPDHWTSKTFINSQNPDVAFFRASLKDNTFLDPEIYQGLLRAYASSPLRIRRELEGECVYMAGSEWLPEYFEHCEFDEWPDPSRGGLKVMALDSSKGKGGKTGDYSAFVMVHFVDGLLYCDADMRNDRDASVITATGVELFRSWQPHYFVVEEEMGQDMLIADMHRIADEQQLLMPITPMGTDKIPKEVRIRRLTPCVSHRQFRYKANSPGAKFLREQMMAFPIGEHDDGPDALEYAHRMLIKATTGMVYPPRGYYHNAFGGVAA